jgi:hypothetical protein
VFLNFDDGKNLHFSATGGDWAPPIASCESDSGRSPSAARTSSHVFPPSVRLEPARGQSSALNIARGEDFA